MGFLFCPIPFPTLQINKYWYDLWLHTIFLYVNGTYEIVGARQCFGSAQVFMRNRIEDPKNAHMDPDLDPWFFIRIRIQRV